MSITRSTSSRYQEGSIQRLPRTKGPDVWVYRWRETSPDGRRVQRKQVIGDVEEYPNQAAARRAVEPLRIRINAEQSRLGKMTVRQAWGHYQQHELHDPKIGRSPTTIELYLDNFKLHIIPRWGDALLEEVKAVQVEAWLRSLRLAPATKSKLRNQLSALFSHCIRHEFYDRLNPISAVRQSSKRVKTPDVLSLDEMRAIVAGVATPAYKLMILIASVTALRRSEIRGLKWADVDTDRLWLRLRQGKVRKHVTRLKTEASRKGVPLSPELTEVFLDWRRHCLYRADEDWVFASPNTSGREPMWFDAVLKNHIRPAAEAAGIHKHIGWHTFRHSVSTVLGEAGEPIKVVSELLRHANIRTTLDLYQQAGADAKRAAQARFKDLFAA